MDIRIVVTQEKALEFPADSLLYIGECKDKEIYDMMVQCVVDKDGNYLSEQEARKLFKKVKYKDLSKHFKRFVEAISEAFVDPTNGGSSSSGSTGQGGLPDGSGS